MARPTNLHDASGVITEAPGVGILDAYGTTVPTDGEVGYATGCTFRHTDGGSGTALYANKGTDTACNFDAVA